MSRRLRWIIVSPIVAFAAILLTARGLDYVGYPLSMHAELGTVFLLALVLLFPIALFVEIRALRVALREIRSGAIWSAVDYAFLFLCVIVLLVSAGYVAAIIAGLLVPGG